MADSIYTLKDVESIYTLKDVEPDHNITFSNSNKTILTIDTANATCHWADGVTVDEAAKCFAECFTYSIELAHGVDKSTHKRAEDMMLEVIDDSKEKGYLTTAELEDIIKQRMCVERIIHGS